MVTDRLNIFERAFRDAPDAQLIIDANGVIVEVNNRVETMLGFGREALIGELVEVLVPEASRQAHTGYRESYQKTPHVRAMGELTELTARCKDGTTLPVDVMLSPMALADEPMVLVAIRDSSARRLLQRNLRRILNGSPDALIIFDPEGTILFVNVHTARIFGYERRRELLGQSVDILVPERFHELHQQSRREYAAAPVRRSMGEMPYLYGIRKGGTEFPLEMSLSPIVSDERLVVSCSLRDITERWAAREALRQSETRYRLLAENASDVIYTMDFDLKFTYVSPSVERQHGWTSEEMMAISLDNLLTPDSMELTKRALIETMTLVDEHDDSKLHDSRILSLDAYCKDGSLLMIETRISIVFDDEGTAVGFLGVSRDITRRRSMEQEKDALEAQLRQVQKMEAIGTLAGGVAHDFNNLLTGILGHIDLMKLRLEEDDLNYRSIEIIERAAGRAQQLTSQLLGFARKGQFQVVELDLNEAIDDVVSFLAHTIPKDIELKLDLSTEPVMIAGDAGQINQVLLNLAVNARDAMPEGGVLSFSTETVILDETFCRTHVDVKPGEYVLITVSDTGVGMSADILPRIFEPFFTARPAGEGTGMGLAMVYGVIMNHRGLVVAESEPAQGARFRVYLPKMMKVADNSEGCIALTINGKGHILVVDDEEMLREVVSSMLQSLGYATTLVTNGQEAIAYIEQHPGTVDLAIVDMIMPLMDGGQCAARLKKTLPDLPVILTSGYTFPDVKGKVESDNIAGFLTKPYRIETLSEVVASALSDSESSS